MNVRTPWLIVPMLTVALAWAPACGTDDGDETDTTADTTTTAGDTASTTATDSTSVGVDVPTTPGTVAALQGEAQANGCPADEIITVNPNVTLSDVVVTSPKFDAFTPEDENATGGLDGYYVADQTGGPWAGINVVVDRATATNWLPGQVLDIQGQLTEFFCVTQVKIDSFTDKGTVSAPAPFEIAGEDVGEPFEGVLVKISGATVLEELFGGVYAMSGDFIVDHEFGFFLSLSVAASYDITGIVTFNRGDYRVIPRTQADVVKLGGGNASSITSIQSGADSAQCTADGLQNLQEDIDLVAVVVSARQSASENLHGYFLSDGTQDDYSGIYATIPKQQATDFAIGEVLAINCRHTEYFCLSQVAISRTEPSSEPLTPPAPLAIAGNLGTEMEKYEGMLVELSNVTVTGDNGHGDAQTDAGLLIDGELMGDGFTVPAANTVYSTVRGFVGWSFDAYRILPRDAADMVPSGS